MTRTKTFEIYTEIEIELDVLLRDIDQFLQSNPNIIFRQFVILDKGPNYVRAIIFYEESETNEDE